MKPITPALKKLARFICSIAGIILGIWVMLLAFAIVNQVAGFWGIFVGLIVLPVTIMVAPLYACIAWGDWLPLLICYGGGFAATILVAIGLGK